MNKFIIQTRKEHNQRGIDVSKAMKEMVTGVGSPWSNYGTEFESVEDAKNKCISMIKKNTHKAENVRMLEVLCEFTSEIIVKTK